MAAEAANFFTASAAPAAASSRTQVAGAISKAAGTTGVSFQYLLATAKMESNLNPTAAAPTSSARGLFQFIDQTWLGTVKEAGARFGYGQYADLISKSDSGSYSVSDPGARSAIMKLRDDPAASAAMAGVLTQSNSFKLTGAIGRRPTESELYMAHFMGVSGAAKLINAAESNPAAAGDALFPKAAEANRPIFYDGAGNARSIAGVYAVLDSRYAGAAQSHVTQSTGTFAVGASAKTASASASSDSAAYLSRFPSVSGNMQATSAAQPASTAADNPQYFRSLFQAGDRAEPVSPAVQELWGNAASSVAEGSISSMKPKLRAPEPLDLFSDRSGAFSG